MRTIGIVNRGEAAMRCIRAVQTMRAREGSERRTYLIALTGYGQPQDRQRSADAGFDLHLVKPVEPDTLNRLLSARVCGDGQGRRGKAEG